MALLHDYLDRYPHHRFKMDLFPDMRGSQGNACYFPNDSWYHIPEVVSGRKSLWVNLRHIAYAPSWNVENALDVTGAGQTPSVHLDFVGPTHQLVKYTAQGRRTVPVGNNMQTMMQFAQIVTITGGDFDADGKRDDLAIVADEGEDMNVYFYRMDTGVPQLFASDLFNIPATNAVFSIAAGDFSPSHGGDELVILARERCPDGCNNPVICETGFRNWGPFADQNIYVFAPPSGLATPSRLLGGDRWNIPSGNNIISVAGLRVGSKDVLAVLKYESDDNEPYNLYFYSDVPAHNALADGELAEAHGRLLGRDMWNAPSGEVIHMTGADLDGDGARDELVLVKAENRAGSRRYYVEVFVMPPGIDEDGTDQDIRMKRIRRELSMLPYQGLASDVRPFVNFAAIQEGAHDEIHAVYAVDTGKSDYRAHLPAADGMLGPHNACDYPAGEDPGDDAYTFKLPYDF